MNARVLPVRAEPLSVDIFAPFGIHAVRPAREPDWCASGSRVDGVVESAKAAGRPVSQLWNVGTLLFEDESPFVGVVRYVNQGYRVAQLERHMHETQTWFARSGSSYLVVAPATPPEQDPSPDTARAFLVEPGDVVALHRAVWMCHFFPLGESADYVVVTARRKPEQDRDLVNFLRTENTVLEIVGS